MKNHSDNRVLFYLDDIIENPQLIKAYLFKYLNFEMNLNNFHNVIDAKVLKRNVGNSVIPILHRVDVFKMEKQLLRFSFKEV